MSIEESIRNIRRSIQNEQFPNEQSVSQGVVLPLLQKQGWPVFDTKVVIPEYEVPKGRVDYALCVNHKPKIFIEVKRLGRTHGADEQVFQYAYHAGTPFVIVTDGRIWHFYLPTEEGSYEERRVYTLDLVERDIEESIKRLSRYLSFEEVKNGNALKNAKDDHRDVSNERIANKSIPLAWGKLLEDKDETLTNLMTDKVENLCGYAPTQEQVIAHLISLKPEMQREQYPASIEKRARPTPISEFADIPPKKRTPHRVKIRVTFLDGTVIYDNQVARTMIEVIKKIGYRKVQALNLMLLSFPIVSQQKCREGWKDAGGGFFVCTHSNTAQKIKQLHEINDQLRLGLKIEEV